MIGKPAELLKQAKVEVGALLAERVAHRWRLSADVGVFLSGRGRDGLESALSRRHFHAPRSGS
jgi:hypothetical protein